MSLIHSYAIWNNKGGGNLEPMAPAINETAEAKALTPSANPWKWTQEIIKNFISHVTSSDEKNWIVFVDTNPSFSIIYSASGF